MANHKIKSKSWFVRYVLNVYNCWMFTILLSSLCECCVLIPIHLSQPFATKGAGRCCCQDTKCLQRSSWQTRSQEIEEWRSDRERRTRERWPGSDVTSLITHCCLLALSPVIGPESSHVTTWLICLSVCPCRHGSITFLAWRMHYVLVDTWLHY